MQCREPECNGKISTQTEVAIRFDCRSYAAASPCEKCRRLYWVNGPGQGLAVFSRAQEPAFLVDGKVVHKVPSGAH